MATVKNETTITEHEAGQVERANASGLTPVMFVHGLWLLPSSWDRWAELFEAAGYAAVTPGWPDDPETTRTGQRAPRGVRAQVDRPGRRPFRRDRRLPGPQAGHHRPFLRRAARTDPRRTRPGRRVGGDRPGAVPRRAAAADLGAEVSISGAGQPGQPAPRGPAHLRPVPLRVRQRRLRGRGQRALSRPSRCPPRACRCSRRRAANLNPWTEAKVDTENPDRGPLLIISGEKDHTVPWAITNASYKHQKHNKNVTEIVEMPGRGPRADHRQRLAGGRRHRPRLRAALRPAPADRGMIREASMPSSTRARRLYAGVARSRPENGTAPERNSRRDPNDSGERDICTKGKSNGP